MKTICFYSIATHLGGAERSLADLMTRLKRQSGGKYEPWLLAPSEDGPLVELCRERGIESSALRLPEVFFKMSRERGVEAVWRAMASVPSMAGYMLKLRTVLRERRPALIHTTGVKCHALAALHAGVSGVPLLWHLRDIFAPGPTLLALRSLKSFGGARVIANSQATARSFLASSDGIEVVYNGLDESCYAPDPNDRYRGLFGVGRDTLIVGVVGVLARWKGQLEFLEMAKKALDAGVKAKFVVVGARIYDTTGDRDYEKALKDEVAALGLSEHVRFVGYEANAALAINGLDVLVHASTRPEPFGRVIVEAWACGVPVMASRAGGVLELITDQETGLLFTPGDSTAMAACLARYAGDEGLRASTVSRARERFLEKFTLDSHVRRIISLYDEILE